MDRPGSGGSRRPGTRAHPRPSRPPELAPVGVVLRQGDRRAPQRVRGPRGSIEMTAPTAPPRHVAVTARPSETHLQLPRPDRADPCTVVILGAGGDLTKRKLLPALYQLAKEDLLASDFRVLGVSREPIGPDGFRAMMRSAIEGSDEIADGIDDAVWNTLSARLHYVAGDLTAPSTYAGIATRLTELERNLPADRANRLFYLAVPPSVFEASVRALSMSGLAPK